MLRLFSQAAFPFIHKNIYNCFSAKLMTKHAAELTMRATRRSFLKKAVLNQAKDIIHCEIRKPSDFVLKLKQEGKCPGVVLPYSKKKQEEIDVVLSGKSMKTRSQSLQYPLQRVYVRAQGVDHMCVLANVQNSFKNFIEKVYFKEYVPGKPNYLTVPILITHFQVNKFYHIGSEMKTLADKVDIICYNQQYPTKFYVDVSFVNPDRPYRVGDLANTFPPGIILNPKADPNKTIFEVEQMEIGNFTGIKTAEQILSNINYGKEKKEVKPAQGGAPAAGGKADGKGDAAKAAPGKAAPGKADAKAPAAASGKKK